jgi:hypothetical protein
MGDTTMRLASVRSASLIGEKSALILVWRLLGDLFGDDVGLRWARDHRDRRQRQTSLKQAQSDRATAQQRYWTHEGVGRGHS